jgi:uracil-DNA glycosylase
LPTKIQLRSEFRKQATGWEDPPKGVFQDIPDDIFPAMPNIYRAFSLVRREDVRYLVLGQDPYYQPGLDGQPIATGVAFSVKNLDNVRNKKDASSLQRVLKGIYGDCKARETKSSLEDWVKCKGILLLNTALTVPAPKRGKALRAAVGCHLDHWNTFTQYVVRSMPAESVTLVAWGKPAAALVKLVRPDGNNVLVCNHPVASRGKLGSFSKFWSGDGISLKCGCIG